MLPPRVVTFVAAVMRKTEDGELHWVFDDETNVISVDTLEFNLRVRHSFNSTSDCGEFTVFYSGGKDRTQYRFFTDESAESDYLLMRQLFNCAQGATVSFPF